MSRLTKAATWAVLTAVLNPLSLFGAPPSPPPRAAVVTDVRLDATGRLTGIVIDANGRRQANVALRLRGTGHAASWTQLKTDPHGRFRSDVLTPGSYHLETAVGVVSCRLWSVSAAPPIAAKSLLVVNDPDVVRGQRPIRELFYSDPLLMAGVVAAAIAIPIAVHKSRDDPPEGS